MQLPIRLALAVYRAGVPPYFRAFRRAWCPNIGIGMRWATSDEDGDWSDRRQYRQADEPQCAHDPHLPRNVRYIAIVLNGLILYDTRDDVPCGMDKWGKPAPGSGILHPRFGRSGPSSASVPIGPPSSVLSIPKMPYAQFQTDMSPGGYWLHTSVALATTPLLLKKIFM